MTVMSADALYLTNDDEANRLLATDPLALLIGFVCDQQVLLQKAFAAPYELRARIGTLDAHAIATMDPGALEAAFKEKPALHRFPGTMAQRTQELCAVVDEEYGGDAARIWTGAADGADLARRLLALPGIGDMKMRSIVSILGKRLDVRPQGWEEQAPNHHCLGDIDSPQALVAYQDAKRAYKASQRAAK